MKKSTNWNILESLPNNVAKAAFMAGGKVTTEKIWQFDEETKWLKGYFVAKVRGIAVSDGDTFKFDTEVEARAFGKSMIEYWKNVSNPQSE